MRKKDFKELKLSITEARRIQMIDEWLNKFPCDKYFKSKTCIHEHLHYMDLYKFIQDCTGGAR